MNAFYKKKYEKPGRPKKNEGERRSYGVYVKLNKDEMKRLNDLVERFEVPRTEILRMGLRKLYANPGLLTKSNRYDDENHLISG